MPAMRVFPTSWHRLMLMAAVVAALSLMSTSAFVSRRQSTAVVRRARWVPATMPMPPPSPARIIPPSPNYLLPQRRPVMSMMMAPKKDDNVPSPGGGLNIDPGTKLLLCILIDLVGIASFAAPGVGEATDVAWAPISALLVNYLFGNGVFTALALVEELLPGFDIIPTATIAWFVENGNRLEESNTEQPPPVSSSAQGNKSPENNHGSSSARAKSATKRPNVSDAIDVEVVD